MLAKNIFMAFILTKEKIVVKIQRLNLAQRNMARLNKSEAKCMHLVDESNINIPLPMKRYNIRKPDGTIEKYTLGDDFLTVSYLRRIGNRYEQSIKHLLGVLK